MYGYLINVGFCHLETFFVQEGNPIATVNPLSAAWMGKDQ
jgi:hypothetical protein